ncbi:MAG TPA: hypothetical protein PLP66_15450, partial [Phycisphaerae bacterium]|nr:hypothetical protein [Phycisphaerae bacterium]
MSSRPPFIRTRASARLHGLGRWSRHNPCRGLPVGFENGFHPSDRQPHQHGNLPLFQAVSTEGQHFQTALLGARLHDRHPQ